MTDHDNSPNTMRQHHEAMLKLVTRSFYNELIKYGISNAEVLGVASHLLDNVLQKNESKTDEQCHNRLFTVKDVRDTWSSDRQLAVHMVTLTPMHQSIVPQLVAWLQPTVVQDSFYPGFPISAPALTQYFQAENRAYFAILSQNKVAGFIGAENIDPDSSKLEMRKLVGDPIMRGQGIGKRATFLFLYYVFVIRKFHKVYIHSMDTNIRNLNLNGKFGFELEGIFLEDALLQNQRRDVVRMALSKSTWQRLFS